MAGRVRFELEARADLGAIAQHWLETTNSRQTTARNLGLLLRDLKRLAEMPILDRNDPRFGTNANRCWYYLKDTDFKVYYLRVGPKTIKVVRIWPSKREPLDPDEIF